MSEEALSELSQDWPLLLPWEQSEKPFGRGFSRGQNWVCQHASGYVSGFMIILSACFLIASASIVDLDTSCSAMLSGWSPLNKELEYTWTMLDPSIPSIYTQNPSPETEAAWEALWAYDGIGILDRELNFLNKSDNVRWVRYTSEDKQYAGQVAGFSEGFHRLHCLHLIRQYSYQDTYNFSGHHFWQQDPEDLLDHVEHCFEYIRVGLQCASDVTPYLIWRDVSEEMPMRVLVNKPAKCNNFDRIRDYAAEHTSKTGALE